MYVSAYQKQNRDVDISPAPVPTTLCLKAPIDQDRCAVNMDIADSNSERGKGLSGRISMKDDQGMIFVFDQPQIQCFWMKDMNFSLDMIWLNEQKEVINIMDSIKPETYPNQFCSDLPAKYVIELTAGSANRLGIQQGQALVF